MAVRVEIMALTRVMGVNEHEKISNFTRKIFLFLIVLNIQMIILNFQKYICIRCPIEDCNRFRAMIITGPARCRLPTFTFPFFSHKPLDQAYA